METTDQEIPEPVIPAPANDNGPPIKISDLLERVLDEAFGEKR